MVSGKSLRVGILFAIAAASTISCGETKFTQPNLHSDLVAVRAIEQFLNSAQQESRELLIDGRATDIEWNISGEPTIVLVKGNGRGGGDYYVSVKSLWTVDRFGNNDAIYFLLQWPDRSEDRLERPLVYNGPNVPNDTTFHCQTDDRLIQPGNWHRSDLREDQATIEIFSDSLGNYPADIWRWGAETTDPVTPVNGAEFAGAVGDGDTLGSTTHPGGAFMEDLYDNGGGPVRDQGKWTYILDNFAPGSNVPLQIVSQGVRDTRLNRGKPVAYCIWETVSKVFTQCEIQNPIRLDDAGVRDKTWKTGDYTPSFRSSYPTLSQLDVIAKGAYVAGKWSLEIRRDLTPRPQSDQIPPPPPWPDDIVLVPGHHYAMRITIFDGKTKSSSGSDLIPLYLKPGS